MTTTDFFTTLKVMWDEYVTIRPVPSCRCEPQCHCDALKIVAKNQEDDFSIRFLKGLSEAFAPVRSQLLLLRPLPHIDDIFSNVIQHERQLEPANKENAESVVFNAKGKFQNPTTAGQGRGGRSGRGGCGSSGNQRPVCSYCNRVGHTVDTCYKKNGYPPNFERGQESGINLVNTSSDNSVPTDAQGSSGGTSKTSLTEQYAKLLNLLKNSNAEDKISDPIGFVNAMLASKTSGPYRDDDWINYPAWTLLHVWSS